jgi:hypothetical protein
MNPLSSSSLPSKQARATRRGHLEVTDHRRHRPRRGASIDDLDPHLDRPRGLSARQTSAAGRR